MTGFSKKQMRSLQRSVSPRKVRARVSDGKEFSYIEGWFAIAEANRIFGFDGWDRETVDTKCIQARDIRGSHTVLYSARVRITVRPAEGCVVRDGYGTGEGRAIYPGEAHDLAIKAAETDATKRALVTFGKAFGLSLYSDRRRRAANDKTHIARGQDSVAVSTNREADNLTTPIATPNSVNGKQPVLTKADGSIPTQGKPPPVPSASSRKPRPRLQAARASVPYVSSPERRARIDKSELVLSEPRRIRDKQHLLFVASQPCVACGAAPADAHHVRFAQPKALGTKVSDEFTVPLCRNHHRELHDNGDERAWWHDMGVEPLSEAKRLWDESRRQIVSTESASTR